MNAVEAKDTHSPEDIAVPFWVTACVRLMPPTRPDGSVITSAADKVLTAAQALLAATIRVHGDEAVLLDRQTIALLCGYQSPKKATWLFDYLQEIEFLTIYRHYVPGQKGRRPDTFAVSRKPPSNYRGPHSFAELAAALKGRKRQRNLFTKTGKTAGQGLGAQMGTKTPDLSSQVGTKTGKTAGQGLGAQMGTKTPDLSSQVGTKTGKTAGQGLGAQMGTFSRARVDQIESSPRIRRGEDSIEPVPGGAAEPPATGLDEQAVAEVRGLVRRLPWQEWAKEKLDVTDYRLTRHDADEIHRGICEAMAREGLDLTLERAAEVARHALAKAKKPGYVARAFKPGTVDEWLRRLEVEPLADDPLPLPSTVKRQVSDSNPAQQPDSVTTIAGVDAGESSKPVLPACSTCDAKEGERFPSFRTVTGEDGREHPCPDCAALGICQPVAA